MSTSRRKMRTLRANAVLVAAGAMLTLLAWSGPASAEAHHQLLGQSPIVSKRGEVEGFRATLLLDPQGLTSNHPTLGGDVRLVLGAMKHIDPDGPASNRNDTTRHRVAITGLSPGYALHQLKMQEITGPNPTDRGPLVETFATGGQVREVEVEVRYKDNPALIPGSKADLVATFWKHASWHVWGAAHGPVTSTQDFVIELPGKPTVKQLKHTVAHYLAEQAKVPGKAALELSNAAAALAHQAAEAARLKANGAHRDARDDHEQARTAAYRADKEYFSQLGQITTVADRMTTLKAAIAARKPAKAARGRR